MTTTKAHPGRRSHSTNGATPKKTLSPEQRYTRQLSRFERVINRAREDLSLASERAFGSTHRARLDDRRLLTAEYQLFDGGVLFDPAEREADARDAELFSDRTHPLGSVEMWANRGVTADATFHRPRNEPSSGYAAITMRVARNIKGCGDLSLEIEATEGIRDTDSSAGDLDMLLAVTPEALVTLATLLPRVVEMARREGLLERAAPGQS